MTRPASFDDSVPINRCGTCKHCHYVRYKEDLLCFHGDEIVARRDGPETWDKSDVELDGEDVEFLDGDRYGKVWASRVVGHGDTCDEWEQRLGLAQEDRSEEGDA